MQCTPSLESLRDRRKAKVAALKAEGGKGDFCSREVFINLGLLLLFMDLLGIMTEGTRVGAKQRLFLMRAP